MARTSKANQIPSPARQTLAGLLAMVLLSGLLLFAAWLITPAPLAADPVQTELLYVTRWQGSNQCTTWHPDDMVDQQAARAMVDHMAGCRVKHTLRPGRDLPEDPPTLEVHLRTLDTYWVVILGEGPDGPFGWAVRQDGRGILRQVLVPQSLTIYLLHQLEGL